MVWATAIGSFVSYLSHNDQRVPERDHLTECPNNYLKRSGTCQLPWLLTADICYTEDTYHRGSSVLFTYTFQNKLISHKISSIFLEQVHWQHSTFHPWLSMLVNKSTQRAPCCQCTGCMNICDEELPQLAEANASCVDPWICLSRRSAGPQCCASQQYCKASWLSSHQNITLLPCKLLTANTWAPQYSGDKGRIKTSATANGSF